MPGSDLPENRIALRNMVDRVAGPSRLWGGVWISFIILTTAFFLALLVDGQLTLEKEICLAASGILGFMVFASPAIIQSSPAMSKFLIKPLSDEYLPLTGRLAMLAGGELHAYHRVRRHFLGEIDYYDSEHGDQIGSGL